MGDEVFGLVLAGGAARRLGGGDKPLKAVGGRTMLDRVVTRLGPQCAGLLISTADAPERFRGWGLAVVADTLPDRPGPLAGVLAGLDHLAATEPGARWLVSVPGDAPFLPSDLVARLAAARDREAASVTLAASDGQTHWTIGLWSVELRGALRQAVAYEGVRKVASVVTRFPHATVAWETSPCDPFFNVNTPADLDEANRLAERFAL